MARLEAMAERIYLTSHRKDPLKAAIMIQKHTWQKQYSCLSASGKPMDGNWSFVTMYERLRPSDAVIFGKRYGEIPSVLS